MSRWFSPLSYQQGCSVDEVVCKSACLLNPGISATFTQFVDSFVFLPVTASYSESFLSFPLSFAFYGFAFGLMLPPVAGSDNNSVLPGLISVPCWRGCPFLPAEGNTSCFSARAGLSPLLPLLPDFPMFRSLMSHIQPAFFTSRKVNCSLSIFTKNKFV